MYASYNSWLAIAVAHVRLQTPGKDDGWKPVLDLNAVIYGLIFLM
jgi:hypothetical protein